MTSMKTNFALALFCVAAVSLVIASGPHTGGAYTVQPAVQDGGGGRSTSSSYTLDGSLLDVEGTGAAGAYAVGHGYIAQLVSTAPPVCPEFVAWQTTHFGSPAAANAGPAFDPDNDGVDNLAEFAFNMDPLVANAAPLPAGGSSGLPRYAVEQVEGKERLTVEFITRPGCQTYELETSDDLTNWTSIKPLEAAPPVPLAGGLQRLKWADDETLGSKQRRLLRVRIGM
jgi:hypothetical protein